MNDSPSAEDAITTLFELYADDVYRFARYMLPDGVDAKDAVQEVFLRAFRAWDRFRAEANAKTWLLRITRNYVYDALRKRHTESSFKQQHQPDLSEVSIPFESLVELEELIAKLAPTYRQVFVLRIVHDLTVAETANVLGWTQAKVKTSLHRALKQLRDGYQQGDSMPMARALPKTGG